jgi:hypothetical protein
LRASKKGAQEEDFVFLLGFRLLLNYITSGFVKAPPWVWKMQSIIEAMEKKEWEVVQWIQSRS